MYLNLLFNYFLEIIIPIRGASDNVKGMIKAMNISVEKGFVRKIGDTEFTKIHPEQKVVG